MTLDLYIFRLINNLSHKWWYLDISGAFLAKYLGFLLLLYLLLLLFRQKNWKVKIYFFSLIVLSALTARGLIVEVIRFFYERPRPFTILGFNPLIPENYNDSFPSGHAAIYFALAAAVWFFNKSANQSQKSFILLLSGATVISLARIFAGIHWPSDILAGALIGFISAFFIKKILPDDYSRYPRPS